MISYSLRRWCAAGVVGCLCMFLTSCGSGRYEPIPETGASLTGTVTYKKELLKIGMVIVAGKTGATGEIGEDGRYKVENVPLGEVTLAINRQPPRASSWAWRRQASPRGRCRKSLTSRASTRIRRSRP